MLKKSTAFELASMVSLQDSASAKLELYTCLKPVTVDRGNGEHNSGGTAIKTYNEIQDLRAFHGCDVHGADLAAELVWHQPRSQQQPTTQSEI